MTIVLGIAGPTFFLSSTIQAQGITSADIGAIQGVPDRVEYLRSLNFFSSHTGDKADYTIKTKLYADPNAKVPTLLASGTVTVGSSNVNADSSFIGGGTGNRAEAFNSTIVGGAKN